MLEYPISCAGRPSQLHVTRPVDDRSHAPHSIVRWRGVRSDTRYGRDVKFRTTVELGGKTATGMAVPAEVVDALGSGKRPAVQVTVGGHSYQTTIASMGGRFLIPLSAENRSAAGVTAGDEIEVEVAPDTSPRVVEVPADLKEVLVADPTALSFFEALSYTHRKEWVRWIEDAKKSETRRARVAKAVAALRDGKRAR